MKLSPMMEQYSAIKKDYEDCILFFRLGDFYEMFFDDALVASKAIELTLTGRNCGLEEKAPMCGVPFHFAENYIARLVEKGFKVAICEQTEDPADAKGIVKREVIKVITPGTITSEIMVKEGENNYLASFYCDKQNLGMAYVDITTGELFATDQTFSYEEITNFINEIVKINPKEVIYNKGSLSFFGFKEFFQGNNYFAQDFDDLYFSKDGGERIIKSYFNLKTLEALGIEKNSGAISALGGLVSYLMETQKQGLNHLRGCKYYTMGNHMSLDKATLRNLEITETIFDGKREGSLIHILDKTKTAMGARKMKQWLREPLNNLAGIQERLDGVEELWKDSLLNNDLREALKPIYDFQRLTGKIGSGSANGRDLIALKQSVEALPAIKALLDNCSSSILISLKQDIYSLEEISAMIGEAIVDEPPWSLREGGIIREGFSQELDHLKHSIKDGKSWILSLEQIERERTGIKNLKVGFNKVFGYYIDVTKSNAHRVPEDYIRKQTLVNNERYITPQLKEVESSVLNGESKINKLEYNLFNKLRKDLEEYTFMLQETSGAIAALDVLVSFAFVSSQYNYRKPIVKNTSEILIEGGRHPVIEQIMGEGLFISNETYLNGFDRSMAIITGPNMAGKSTYMRQTALIVLMAQVGCFVPCERGEIGIVDRIFTRIGASDNLSQGESTFYVEMSELAYILNSATEKSLVILDEIGRGTSTYDGMSIAFATANYLCREDFKVRTMFATHYHELTVLEEEKYGAFNLNVDVADDEGDIVFLHKIVAGSASRSYGIHVAKIAGVPKTVLEDAQNKLISLENQGFIKENSPYIDNQLSFFNNIHSEAIDDLNKNKKYEYKDNLKFNKAQDLLKQVDLMDIKPSKAIELLEKLKDVIDD